MSARPARVLHVLEAIETGCARHLADVVTTARTVEHHLAIPERRVGGHTDHAAVSACVAAGATVHRVEMRRSTTSPANVKAVRAVRAIARETGADVVHGHSSIGGVVARLAAPRSAAVAYTPNGLATGTLATVVERGLRRRTDRLVAVSASEAEDAIRRRFADEAHIVVIPNGIDLSPPPARSLRDVIGVGGDVPLVGSLGRLVPQKAPEVLLEAWAQVADARPDLHFVLIGDGDDDAREEVRSAASTGPLGGRLHWVPFLESAAAHLGDLDVFVLTSRFEGGPYAPLEAMRAGVATVLTDVVGNRDVVDDGHTGLLVPGDDPAATARAVVRLAADDELRRRLAASATAALCRFDVEASGAAHDRLYAELIAASDVPSPDAPRS